MTVTLAFTEAEIYQWQYIGEPVAQAVVDNTSPIRGQVSAFDSTREDPAARTPGCRSTSRCSIWQSASSQSP
jgi:hypothetical protein